MNPRAKTYTILGMRKLVSLFFILTLVVYFITSSGKTPYDYFTRLADSFAQGKYYLEDNPPWLSELIPAENNKYYVVYPPMPAILSIPFVLIFGHNFQQQYLAHILGAGIVGLTMLTAWKFKKDLKLLIFIGLLVSVGNIIWFLSSVGSSWYLGQVCAAFFMTAAIYESLNKKRAILTGIFLGAMFLSRIHTVLIFPLFLYLYFDKKMWLKNYLSLTFGAIPFLLFNFYYNFVRFGTIFDQAYFILPSVLNELDKPWFANGVANPIYIPNNLRVMFLSFPVITQTFPYIIPSWAGLAIWITTPLFIFTLFNKIKDKLVLNSWISIILIFIVVASHGGTGWTQFGYRFAVDFYPLLFLLLIKYFSHNKIKKIHWILLFIGIVVNTWGVLFINKFGFVTF